MYLIKAFKESLHVAMQLYEKRLTKKQEQIPEHRIFDLIELRAIIDDNDKTIQETYDLLQQTMAGMMTGLIINDNVIFSTGNSRLQDHLHQVLDRPRYTLENLLGEQAEAAKKNQAMENISAKQLDNECLLLKQKLSLQQGFMEKQAEQIQLLEQQNQLLQQEVSNLKALLAKFQQANTNTSHKQQSHAEEAIPGGDSNAQLPNKPPSNNPFDDDFIDAHNAPPTPANGAYCNFFN